MNVPPFLRAVFAPPERLSVSEWADRYRKLPATDPRPGNYLSSFMPFWREPMNAYLDPLIEEICIQAGAQVGKSRLQENFVGFIACEQPVDAMMVLPRDQDVRIVLKDRLGPMIRLSPAISEQLSEGASNQDAIRFRRCVLYLTAAGSAAGLASKSCATVLIDELDKYLDAISDEGSPVDLARQRTNAFVGRRKIVTASTPTTDARGIAVEMKRSDQRKYHLPCPSCGHFQPLTWEQVDFGDERDPDKILAEGLAWYRCESCGDLWTDEQRVAQLKHGVWVPKGATVTEEGEVQGAKFSSVRGYYVTGLLSPLRPMSDFVARFLRAHGSRKNMRTFFQSDIGRTHADIETSFDQSDLEERVGDYKLGEVPEGVEELVCGVDVGKQVIHWVVRGFAKGMESWLVARGLANTLDEIEGLLEEEFDGETIRLSNVDSGWKPRRVYDLAARHKSKIRPIKGGSQSKKPVIATPVEQTRSGKTKATGVKLFTLDTHWFKDELADLQESGRWHLPCDIDEVYLEHLSAERKELDSKGVEVWRPKSEGIANHYLDAEVYALAAARMRGLWKQPNEPATPKPTKRRRTKQPTESTPEAEAARARSRAPSRHRAGGLQRRRGSGWGERGRPFGR
ncbi:MAG: terminase gpA endonuclease subunit [Planctomycetota bacterium]